MEPFTLILFLTLYSSSSTTTNNEVIQFIEAPELFPDEVTMFTNTFWTLASTNGNIQKVFNLPFLKPDFLRDVFNVMKNHAVLSSDADSSAYATKQTELFESFATELTVPGAFATVITGTIGRYFNCFGFLNESNAAELSRQYYIILDGLSKGLGVEDNAEDRLKILLAAKGKFLESVGMVYEPTHDAVARFFEKSMRTLRGLDTNSKKWCLEM